MGAVHPIPEVDGAAVTTRPLPAEHDVVVVGGGPAGLACAAALVARRVSCLVLERGDNVGARWRDHYRCLRLNSGRSFSHLPGLRFPLGTPTFPSRDAVVRHLEEYRDRWNLEVRERSTVGRLDPVGRRWRISTAATSVVARHVVVATGLWSEPVVPSFLGTSDLGPPVVHSAQYQDPSPYEDKTVLVVGAGSSGMEIAHDLVMGGAGRVVISVRTPPNILPRSVVGLPGDPAILLMLRIPPTLADRQLRLLRRVTIGDLSGYGLPIPADGPFTRLRRDGGTPTVVDRGVVQAIRTGRIQIVSHVVGLETTGVRLADGSLVEVDAVIAATGFRTDLDPLVGHLGVLDETGLPRASETDAEHPGLWFANFRPRPGLLRAAGQSGQSIAKQIARHFSRT